MKKTTHRIEFSEVKDNKHLPDGWYGLSAEYCPNPECHCNEAQVLVARLKFSEVSEAESSASGVEVIAHLVVPLSRKKTKVKINPPEEITHLSNSAAGYVKEKIEKEPHLLDKWRDEYSSVKANLPPTVVKKLNAVNKIGRNDPCGCGSGKKYKKCCLLQVVSGETLHSLVG